MITLPFKSAFRSEPRVTAGRYAVLDIGTAKVACFVAEIDTTGNIRVLGVGNQLAKGLRGSVITDAGEAETSIIAAVHAAEQMAGTTVEDVVVSLSGGGIASRAVRVEMPLSGEAVSDRDLLDVIERGQASVENENEELIHCFPVSYSLDSAKGIADPRQMYGSVLGAELHTVLADGSITRNLARCIGRCHLNVEEFVIASHASALACLDEDERQLGVTLVDMGAGTTGFSIFAEGKNQFSHVIPVGGAHVTSDIARGLSTTLMQAERMKTLHGSCMPSPQDDQVMVSAPLLGEDGDDAESNVIARSMLVGIIRPRIEEVMEMLRGHIEASGLSGKAGRRVVLTGGASQLLGMREMATRMLGRQVRLAKPRAMPGLAEAVSGPAFSAGLGMLHYLAKRPLEDRLLESETQRGGIKNRVKAVTGWLKENF